MKAAGDSGSYGSVQASDGRMPGARGLATRQRLLDCVETALSSVPYRELRVTDVARTAGTSPATFYQYFLDVDAAVLVLAERTADFGSGLVHLIEGQRWQGAAGLASAQRLVEGFLDLWHDKQPVLRVMDLLTAEGDIRFRAARVRMLNAVTLALASAIDGARATANKNGEESPVPSMAVAGALVSMLAHVAAHQVGFESWDIQVASLREAMTQLVYWGVNEPRLPKPVTATD
jgi:AcrR family transcriptional regulator